VTGRQSTIHPVFDFEVELVGGTTATIDGRQKKTSNNRRPFGSKLRATRWLEKAVRSSFDAIVHRGYI
jgi:hypothetical protein